VLTFVPTPIGNLEDISFRSIKALKDGELILCEDTRVTKQLINLLNQRLNLDIDTNKKFLSVHSHNEENFISAQFEDIYKNQNVVYVSDAGMPCVSDPGAKLVAFCIKHNIPYDVIPGANALLTAYAMSGFDEKEFTFFGFLPHKSGNRKSPLFDILNSPYLTILYESPHRIMQLFEELNELETKREVFAIKELTKLHQRYLKGEVGDILKEFQSGKVDLRGEWVIIIKGSKRNDGENLTINDIKSLDLPPKQKAKLISKMTGKSIKEIYEELN